jgi:conjugative transfer signal peptidase TraF
MDHHDPVGSCFSFSLRPFSEGHCGLMSTLVTRAGEPAVTRAIFLFESLLIGAALMVFWGQQFGLRIMLTDSAAPVGIYRVEPLPSPESGRDLRRGELVEACLPDAIAQRGLERGYLQPGGCPGGAEPVAKRVGALSGDIVIISAGYVAVNGNHLSSLSETLPIDSRGRLLEHVTWGARQVSPNTVWLFGFNNPRSWDSRYFGPVLQTDIRGVLTPVVTWR